jgi:hypothetical protein
MSMYNLNPPVGPIGYQPVEFLDIPPMSETIDATPGLDRTTPTGRLLQSRQPAGGDGALVDAVRVPCRSEDGMALSLPPFGRIADIDSLREHLQCAIELEHATLPVYLCALYSLDAVRNPAAAEILLSVFVEEMLHLSLAANLLNAVGGRPRLDTPSMLPGYPRTLPHGQRSLEISLLAFGPEAVEQLLTIERPAPAGAPPQGDRYETIGQFYDAVRRGLRELCDDYGQVHVFSGDPARQVTDTFFYGGSGRVIPVDSLATATAALDEIVEQGEGAAHHEVWDGDRDMFHPERGEVGHYFRIQELKLGRRYRPGDTPRSGPSGDAIAVDWDGVRPMRRNPRTADHPSGCPIRAAQDEWNRSYSALLRLLDEAFDGSPQLLGKAIGAMYGLKAQGERLMQTPTEDGLASAGPTFEYVPPDRRP